TAFVNLLENAVKYSRDEPKISIRLKKAKNNRSVEIFIKDNGVGIQSSELKRIFKRFYRVVEPTSADTRGTGLGLFIVKSIIERHGGRVSAQSRGDGLGSTFLVKLPIT
ncbi:MAG: sensor histidine kinase, partial [Acidobacteriota bacterium]